MVVIDSVAGFPTITRPEVEPWRRRHIATPILVPVDTFWGFPDERFDKNPAKDQSLETWLHDRAFRQHCVLFHQRPFVWHIWDGLRDGFSALVHYHRLDRTALEKLTYSLLGDWIARAKAEGQTTREERAQQLQQRLAAILEGEPPYDIFVRWKPLARQPIGWEPDLDDGVRLNIRPFVVAEVLLQQSVVAPSY